MTQITAITIASMLSLHPVTAGFQGRLAYARQIDRCASTYNLDSLDVIAIILIESSGIPDVVNSRSRATGLMGIMPSDAPEDVRQYFVDRPTSEELKDPELNIEWGCKILREFIDRYGDLKSALHHYSGGGPFTAFEAGYWSKFRMYRDALSEISRVCWRLP